MITARQHGCLAETMLPTPGVGGRGSGVGGRGSGVGGRGSGVGAIPLSGAGLREVKARSGLQTQSQ